MLGLLTAIASVAAVSSVPMPRLSDSNPVSLPPIIDIAKYLELPKARPRYPMGDVRPDHARYRARHAMRKPLQWGTCDENMTLVGSTCVCSSGFYSTTSLTPAVLNSVNYFCTGLATSPNLALMGTGTGGAVTVDASAYYSGIAGPPEDIIVPNPPYNQGSWIRAAAVGQDAWARIDLGQSKLIGGVKLRHWGWDHNDDYNRFKYKYMAFSVWAGDDTTYNGQGNVKCFENAPNLPEGAAFRDLLTATKNDNLPPVTINCVAAARYVFFHMPANPSLFNNGIPGESMSLKKVQIFPPQTCAADANCLPCDNGKTSNPNSQSISDCFVDYGIDVNASLVSVDVNYTQENFFGLLPSYMSVLNYTDDLDVYLDSCPAGYYCLAESTMPTPCPAGTYRDALGGTEVGDCSACPAGAYCPIGSAEPISCPAGRYRGTTGAQQPTDCGLCPTGQFCPQGSVSPQSCLVGTYRDTTGATQAADCPICPAGKFCGSATTTPSLCAAGTYNDQPGGVTQADCYACPTGHYCEAGTVTPTDCPAGTYRAATGATAVGNCLACPAGKYCPIATTTPESCAAGTFFSTTGADEQADCSDCPTGYYCPAASVNPTACVSGTYRNATAGATSDVCLPCTEGFYCPQASTAPTECPGGTYRNVLGATQSADCFICPSGQYCGVATVTPTSCAPGTFRATTGASLVTDCLACPVAQYCPLATTTPVDCPGGTYRGETGGVDRSSCTTCPTGRYCPQESTAPTLCPAGTYRAAVGANSVEDCLPCPHGQYCVAGTTTPTSCPAGTFLNGTGGAGSTDCQACPIGQYCPVRSTVPTDCDAGSYRGTEGAQSQGQCTVCPAGQYCLQKSVAPTDCPAGTYRGASGAVSAEDCLPCPAGKHCAAGTVTPALCSAGSYRMSTGGAVQADCTTCPAGAYCVAGSVSPALCGPGRHRDTPGAVQLSNCLLCMPGSYSLDVGRTSNCPACQNNFYCRTSTLKEACPMHTTSVAGSYSRVNCKCDPGYSCTYYKRIQAIVTLNATAYEFNNNVGGVRDAFIASMALAAGVTANHVTINGVVARQTTLPTGSGSRRLLSLSSRLSKAIPSSAEEKELSVKEEFEGLKSLPLEENADNSAVRSLPGADPEPTRIRVFATVANAGRLNHLEHKLHDHAPGLFISHRWERHSSVKAEKAN